MKSRGFTLIELMVVIVIIGILATIVVARVWVYGPRAYVTGTRATLKSVRGSIEMFRLNHHRFPDRLEELVQRPAAIEAAAWPEGGYLDEAPKDAWGRPLVYLKPGPNEKPYEVMSLGEDGIEGGEGLAADLR